MADNQNVTVSKKSLSLNNVEISMETDINKAGKEYQYLLIEKQSLVNKELKFSKRIFLDTNDYTLLTTLDLLDKALKK